MDIYLSGDIRKDKRVDGYVLNPNHYPFGSLSVIAGGSSGGIDAQFNIIVDSFDYSNNFIDRKSSFYDRGSTGGGSGVLISWNQGYKNNVYVSGASFNGYSGISITDSTSFTYTDTTKKTLNINGLPNYTGLTTTSATTLSGNVLIKAVSATTYLLQYNVSNNADFMMDIYKYNDRVVRVNTPGTYNHLIDMSGITSTNLWVDFFIRSTDEVRLNNIKLFSIQ